MYRRIEVLLRIKYDISWEGFALSPEDVRRLSHQERQDEKRGVWGFYHGLGQYLWVESHNIEAVARCFNEASMVLSLMRMPKKNIRPGKCYFTEKGWDEMGRRVVGVLKKHKMPFRVSTVREKDFDAMFEDKWQVVLRARKAA